MFHADVRLYQGVHAVDGAGDRSVERRHLTVLFTDLVGSTGLARSLDPEELLSLTLSYQKAVETATAEFGGHVARVVGDGVLIYFGWPRALEDAAEYAVRAALAVHDALESLSLECGYHLQCKAAIATGSVVVGDVERFGVGQTSAVFGEAPHLADRLQALAGPGGLVVSEETMKLVRGRFECLEIGEKMLDGFDKPVASYRVIAEKPHVEDLADRMVGRRDELAHLIAAWGRAKAGDGGACALIGEAGIGKTQLMKALRDSDEVAADAVIIYQCERLQQSTSYYPLLTQFRRWIGVRQGDPATHRRRRIREKLAPILTEEQLRLSLALTMREGAEGISAEEMSEQRYRGILKDAMMAIFGELLKTGPKLVLFEDAHWADPSTRDIMNAFMQAASALKVLCVCSTRPSPDVVEALPQEVAKLHLSPLGRAEAEEMISASLDDAPVEDVVVRDILDRANGVPLFIRACVDTLTSREGENLRTVPASLQGLLLERLDHLGDLRDVTLAAAAIGCPFDARLLGVVADLPLDEAERAIEQLRAAGVLITDPTKGPGVHTFRHILQQEAAYGCLVKERRKTLHGRIVEHLNDPATDPPDWEPEFLAFHYQAAGQAEVAIGLWSKAAQSAMARFAHEEALSHTEKGVALLPDLTGPEAKRMEVDLYASRGAALRAIEGFGALTSIEVTRKAFERAVEIGDRRTTLHAGRALSVAHHVRAEYENAQFYARQIESEIGGYRFGHMIVRSLLAMPMIWQGRFRQALDELDKAKELAASKAQTATDLSFESQITSLRGVTMAFLGHRDEALSLALEGVEAARQSRRPLVLASAIMLSCNTHQILLDAGVMDQAQALRQLAIEQRLPFYKASAASFIAAAHYNEGEVDKGLDLLNKGWKAFQATTSRANQLLVCRELARGYLMKGATEEGLKVVENGLDRAEAYGEENYLAEVLRLKGELLEQQGAAATRCAEEYDRAIMIARGQGAGLFERWAIERRLHLDAGDAAAELRDRLEELPA